MIVQYLAFCELLSRFSLQRTRLRQYGHLRDASKSPEPTSTTENSGHHQSLPCRRTAAIAKGTPMYRPARPMPYWARSLPTAFAYRFDLLLTGTLHRHPACW